MTLSQIVTIVTYQMAFVLAILYFMTDGSTTGKNATTSAQIIADLTTARKAQGLSHETLAAMTKLHRSTISLIESGKREPTLRTLLKIAAALNVKLSDILKGHGH